METIWKFELSVTDEQVVNMPFGAKILSVQVQNGIPCIWALVNPTNSKELKTIYTYGTGNPIENLNPDASFVGTYQLHNGSLVFHVFEIIA